MDDAADVLARLCACQFGPCGHCTADAHDECTHIHHEPNEFPAAWLAHRRDGHVLAEVYEVGHRHVWRCSCLPTHGPRAVQDDLLSLLAAS